ncbi:hypothetical protein JHK82_022290 [Glycine max]|nr:hypothetical protein JHK82_022290 [Glycine max]
MEGYNVFTLVDATGSTTYDRRHASKAAKGIGKRMMTLREVNHYHPMLDLDIKNGSLGYDPPPCGDEANSVLELLGEATTNAGYVKEGSKTNLV